MDARRVRMLFALLGGIVFLVLLALFPGLPFSEEATVGFFGLIAAYILGEGLDGGAVKSGLLALLKSAKFLALLAGIIVLVVQAFWPEFPISTELLTKILEALILGAGAQGAIARIRISSG